MPENTISTKLQLQTDGTAEAIQDYELLQASAEKTAAAIEQANQAAQGLNSSIADFAPLQMEGADFWSPENQTKVKAASKGIKDAGDRLYDTGKAGDMLANVLDNVVPGLGNVFESFTSLNPVAIASTAAIAGVVAIFGEMQRQAEEAKKAVEEAVAAESARVVAQAELDQRVNLAMAGNKEARESVIKDLAANQAQAAILDQQRLSNEERRLQAQKDLDAAWAAQLETLNNKNPFDRINEDAAAAAATATNTLEALKTEAEGLETQINANNTAFEQLTEATKDLNISEAELNAVRLAGIQGADGAAGALDKLWGSLENGRAILEDTGGKVLDVFKKVGETAAEGVNKTVQAAMEARADAEKRLIDINAELADVEAERGRVEADRLIEAQRAREMGALEAKLVEAQAYDAARAKNARVAEIEQQGNAAQLTAEQKFMENQQKLLSSYLKAEQNATEDYSRERVRKLEDLYNTLNDLASQRDVAGFVNARRSGMTDLSRGDEDASTAARRRREQYDQQAKDLEASFAKENAVRQQQQQQRLQQAQREGQQEVSQASIVQKQIADLRARYAEQDLRARRMQEDATYRQTVDILVKKRNDELKITAGTASKVIEFFGDIQRAATRLVSTGRQVAGRAMPAYAEGSAFIPRDQVAFLHRGERVMTAAENAQYMRGSGGRQLGNLTINMTVGDVATGSMVRAEVGKVFNAITSYGANSNV